MLVAPEFSALSGPVYLLAVSVPLSFFDVKQRRLPNKLVLPGFPISLLGQILAGILTRNFWAMLLALLCCVVVFAVALLANRAGAMGMGDVKLMALIAMSFGWWGPSSVLIALGSGFIVAALAVLAFFMVGHQRLTSTIPLGPYLLFGVGVAFTALVWS